MSRRIPNPVTRIVFFSALALSAGGLPGVVAGDTNIDHPSMTGRDMGQTQGKPNYVTVLEDAYGTPSQAGFGSAVFYETLQGSDDLTKAALARYRYFVGELWERYGEEAWMGPWKEVYSRQADERPDIVAELRGIADRDARLSVPMILDNIEGAEAARGALSAAFDDPAITELRVFNLGDGEAMSGLLVAARRGTNGETVCLVFLMD